MVFEWLRKKSLNLEAMLNEGGYMYRYLGVLETYDVEWTLEKVARDTLQNFFDSNKGTLDNVVVEITREERDRVVRIEGQNQYDFRRLLHLGGTTKHGDISTVGGIGEGAKILALVLLRDYGFSQVRFGSGEWELDFSLDAVPKEDYPEKRKGLFACLRKADAEFAGNFVELKTTKQKHLPAFENAKDLFYHSENPDFQNPTLDVPKVGGFKFLGKGSIGKEVPCGNFYYAGQRRHFKSEEWQTLEYIHLWTHKKFGLKRDRDRGIVTRMELHNSILPPIVKSIGVAELTRVIYELEPIWEDFESSKFYDYYEALGTQILWAVADRLEKKGVKLDFEDKYVASQRFLSSDWSDYLKKQGYILCFPFMEQIGMENVEDKLSDLTKHYRIQLTADEAERVEMLYRAIALLDQEKKEIRIFDREKENTIVDGQYDKTFVWLSKERLNGVFNRALGTYLHELDHQYGSDASAKFSSALTNTLDEVIGSFIRYPDYYKRLEQQWNDSLENDE